MSKTSTWNLNVENEDFTSNFHTALNYNNILSFLANIIDDFATKKIASDDLKCCMAI